MNGETLYAVYQKALLQTSNCGSDSWDQLDDSSQADWNYMAELLNEGEGTLE